MTMEPSDDELVDRWRGGDRRAGRVFIERHHAAVLRFFYNKTDESSQQDLVQQTFLSFVSGLERLSAGTKIRSYLFGTAYLLLCKHYETKRVERERAARAEIEPAPATSPSRAIARREELRLLLGGLRRLPFDLQVPLELHYWEQMTTHDIAEILGVPSGTIKSRLRRGRELLTKAMAELAASPAILRSTVDDINRWVGCIRAQLAAAAPPQAP